MQGPLGAGRPGHLGVAKAAVRHAEGSLGAAARPLAEMSFPKAQLVIKRTTVYYLSWVGCCTVLSHIDPESTWGSLAARPGPSTKSAGRLERSCTYPCPLAFPGSVR